MEPEPIRVDCEGAGCPTHLGGMCQMCGRIVPVDDRYYALPHKRRDILAMIERGDFDG